ncbi:MAG: DsbA family protein [Acidimicrobiales bacterium]
MRQIEVFADIACPFAHAGLRTFVQHRAERGLSEPRLLVRAWPLELVNSQPHDGRAEVPNVEGLRAGAAPELFAGFDPGRFPATTLPALAAAATAYAAGPVHGEAFSLAVRDALWEHGLDVTDPDVLERLCSDVGIEPPAAGDDTAVRADLADGRARGVAGSPHFFTDEGDFFCPSLDIEQHGRSVDVSFDVVRFRRFTDAAFA